MTKTQLRLEIMKRTSASFHARFGLNLVTTWDDKQGAIVCELASGRELSGTHVFWLEGFDAGWLAALKAQESDA